MESKNYKASKKKTGIIIMTAILNIALIAGVVLSVIFAFKNAENVSFSQNIENIRVLTDSSANKVELEVMHHSDEVRCFANYVNNYETVGMTYEELIAYAKLYFTKEDNENISYQLVDNTLNNNVGARNGFNGICLSSKNQESIVYKMQAYPELAKELCTAGEDKIGELYYTNEFTDPSSSLSKSFAIATTVRIRENSSSYQYKTLMLLIRSDYINELISNNNDIDTLSYYAYSNIIIDNNGNYVISNESFQGTNFIDYIKLYNSKFDETAKKEIIDHLFLDNYSETFFYNNNREQKCAYTIVPVQNSNWHILSIVPLDSFRNEYIFNYSFIMFALLFMALFAMDITIILIINRKLVHRTKEAQAANIAKSSFLSSMSHDIRTPMNAIIGMTVIANESLNQNNPDIDTLKECVNTIKLSGNHLLTLVNDILDISKIENGKNVIAAEDFSIRSNMNKMLEMVQAEINNKELNVGFDVENIEHEFVHADRLRINQIYLNILSNAIKYTEAGGSISVALTEEKVPDREDTARYIYRVEDSGIGMDEEFQKTIFDRFSRAVDTRVNKTQGSGLGMAISKQLVDLMGGSITVESELNKGSVFTVILELAIAKAAAGNEEIITSGNENRNLERLYSLRVLVAEDNEVNWKVIRKILEMKGIQADHAVNGKEALDMAAGSEVPYDLILMDIQMPVMDGYEAAEGIRNLKDSSRNAVSIYAMTADTFAEDVERCRERGMNGHLGKPFEMDRLIKILDEVNSGIKRS